MTSDGESANPPGRVGGSFRDPSGYVYRDAKGVLRRQVNRRYAEDFALLTESGLLSRLTDEGVLIRHEPAPLECRLTDDAIAVFAPEPVPFFSYPYEWCFEQYRDAALLTLDVQDRALASGMVLKDASAFNVTFLGARPVFVDVLSFERYVEGRPWIAYAQFCRHFLAPLALMSRVDTRLGALMRDYVDGVPLDLAARMLPKHTWLTLGLALHIHLHARAETRHSDRVAAQARPRDLTPRGLRGILSNLRSTIASLRRAAQRSIWRQYAKQKPYTADADKSKSNVVGELLSRIVPKTVWDLGANTGEYAEIAHAQGATVIAFERDGACVEAMYAKWRSRHGLTPVCMDLTNPSPALGWGHEERQSLMDRGPVDCVLALALIHHIRIGNNVPMTAIAAFFAAFARHLIIEFVPKDDPMPQTLLLGRADIFDDYTRSEFERVFAERFEVRSRHELPESRRVIYWMERRSSPRHPFRGEIG